MFTIQENIDGTLYIKDGLKIIDTIDPQYNLDESVELLKQFNRTIINDKKLNEKWSYNGFFILPALQEWIFWDYFVPIVKYKKLFQNNYVNKINFSKSKVTEGLIGLFKYRNITKKQPNIILRITKKILLKILQFIYPIRENILIYDDGLYGFRYTKVKELLAAETSYSRIHLLNKK